MEIRVHWLRFLMRCKHELSPELAHITSSTGHDTTGSKESWEDIPQSLQLRYHYASTNSAVAAVVRVFHVRIYTAYISRVRLSNAAHPDLKQPNRG